MQSSSEPVSLGQSLLSAMGEHNESGGTGSRFGRIVIILAGVSALIATSFTCLSVWLQTKNYRKPLLQRYVIRILVMVPIYCAASWASLISLKAAFWIEPLLDVYEAFTIYAFFQLLINFIGGERSLIIMMHGRAPVSHLWPLNHCVSKIDISDPHTFLAIKRGILQYTWIKPVLAIATIAMKATGTFQQGYIGVTSGYLWSGIIYNISITICLYALAMFWICMSVDLAPFRPMPKFICIKGIIFASYWQGLFLSILVFLGAIPNAGGGYTPDNLAAAIQDALICFEMPFFALLHWYAFSWHDYADVTISAARMPVKYALRDAFGSRDLIEDAKETFAGAKYEYRNYDGGDNVLAHEDSNQREARMMEGMRYSRGKGKYWIPKPGADGKTPLLKDSPTSDGSRGSSRSSRSRGKQPQRYGATENVAPEDPSLDSDDERLYDNARELEFGDFNYPVITAHHASREDRLYREPDIITASTNRNLLQPTKENRKRRQSRIKEIQKSHDKGKHRDSSSSAKSDSGETSGILSRIIPTRSKSNESTKSHDSQLVDLVVEDEQAEQIERVRARKEGGAEWNKASPPKHFVRAYPGDEQEEEVRDGIVDDDEPQHKFTSEHPAFDNEAAILDEDEVEDEDMARPDQEASEESKYWKERNYTKDNESDQKNGSFEEEANVWRDSPKR